MSPSWGIPLQPALFREDRHVIRTYSRIFQTYLLSLLAGKFTLIVLIVRHAFIILPLGTRSLAGLLVSLQLLPAGSSSFFRSCLLVWKFSKCNYECTHSCYSTICLWT